MMDPHMTVADARAGVACGAFSMSDFDLGGTFERSLIHHGMHHPDTMAHHPGMHHFGGGGHGGGGFSPGGPFGGAFSEPDTISVLGKTVPKTGRLDLGSKHNSNSLRSKLIEHTWESADKIPGKNPDLYREDAYGNCMYKPSYGKRTEMGWELDHK